MDCGKLLMRRTVVNICFTNSVLIRSHSSSRHNVGPMKMRVVIAETMPNTARFKSNTVQSCYVVRPVLQRSSGPSQHTFTTRHLSSQGKVHLFFDDGNKGAQFWSQSIADSVKAEMAVEENVDAGIGPHEILTSFSCTLIATTISGPHLHDSRDPI